MNKAATNDAMDMLTHQRTVPARAAPKPETTAANSVFNQARPAKQSRPRPEAFDPLTVSIRKNVALPPAIARAGAGNRSRALLDRMVTGDCALLAHVHARSVVAQARKLGIKVAARRLDADNSGVWRLS